MLEPLVTVPECREFLAQSGIFRGESAYDAQHLFDAFAEFFDFARYLVHGVMVYEVPEASGHCRNRAPGGSPVACRTGTGGRSACAVGALR